LRDSRGAGVCPRTSLARPSTARGAAQPRYAQNEKSRRVPSRPHWRRHRYALKKRPSAKVSSVRFLKLTRLSAWLCQCGSLLTGWYLAKQDRLPPRSEQPMTGAAGGDQLCVKWFRWFEAQPRCLNLQREGQKIYWQDAEGKSGTATITASNPQIATIDTTASRAGSIATTSPRKAASWRPRPLHLPSCTEVEHSRWQCIQGLDHQLRKM
jgi:hypothetical protein